MEQRDPVCGMMIEKAGALRAHFRNETYYFCSQKCHDKFLSHPESFITQKKIAPGEESLSESIEYTCPMHPEVRQFGPGECPKCGMTLEPVQVTLAERSNPELKDFRRRFWWTMPLTVIVTILAMSGVFFDEWLYGKRQWVEFILSTPVALWSGWPFYYRGVQSIIHRTPNMWTLIGLGTATAYVYSVIAILFPHVFPESFESMAMLRFTSKQRRSLSR